MIDLTRVWLPQIIGCAEGFLDGTLEKAWAEGDRTITSAYYSAELYEQIFDDLDSDTMILQAHKELAQYPDLIRALDAFLDSLKRLDTWIEAHVDTDTWG